MHELGIVFHMIKTVERIAEENVLTSVSSVTLELGEVSGVVPHELTSCWNWAVAQTEVLKGAVLRIETIPAVTLCENCTHTYPDRPAGGASCPPCGQERNLFPGQKRDQSQRNRGLLKWTVYAS